MVSVPFLNHTPSACLYGFLLNTNMFSRRKKNGEKKHCLQDAPYSLLPCAILVGVWMLRKPQGRAAKDKENNIYMRQQQVSTLQIRALGALCRVLSQVWRWRIALAIPRLQKVWTKYAANLFCAELEGKGEKKTGTCFGFACLPFALSFLFAMCNSVFLAVIFLFHQCSKKKFLTQLQHMLSEVNQDTYVPVQMVISFFSVSDIKSTANHQTRIKKKTRRIQQAQSNRKDKERVWALAQEWLILGELARPTASKCITYGVPFSQLPQREHKKCYISLSETNKQWPRYAESVNKGLR